MSASGTPLELRICTATACLLLFSHIGLAMAADGRVEISQACAEVGCFDGDSAGFPVNITNPGSYVLTSDLDITGVGSPHNRTVIAIHAEANGTVIDMNGFSIIGPNSCAGDPVKSCDNNGSGDGIFAGLATGITVRNGRIVGMGRDGISLQRDSLIEDMMIEQCGRDGIEVGVNSIIRNNRILRNMDDGIEIGSGSGLITGNVIGGSGDRGIQDSNGTGISLNVFRPSDDVNFQSAHQLGPNLCGTIICPE